MAKPETFRVSGRTYGYKEAEPRWHGTGLVCGPSATLGAWTEIPVQCEHFHRTIEAATACGTRLAAAKARELAREAEERNTATPCTITAQHFDTAGGLWLKGCTAHRSAATRLKPTEAEALADEWSCPWAPFVRTTAETEA